jgi:hypothetical protein
MGRIGWPGRGPLGAPWRWLPGVVPGTGPRLPVGIAERVGTVGRAEGAADAAAAGRTAEGCVPVPGLGRGAAERVAGGAAAGCPAGATGRVGVAVGAVGAVGGGAAAGFAAGGSLAGARASTVAAGPDGTACGGLGGTPVAGATAGGGTRAGAEGFGTAGGTAAGAAVTGAAAGLMRAAFAAASFASFSALAAASAAASASAIPWRCLRTFSATSTVMELECVFFSVTPYPGKRSMMALALTSSSRASSLMRTWFASVMRPVDPDIVGVIYT